MLGANLSVHILRNLSPHVAGGVRDKETSSTAHTLSRDSKHSVGMRYFAELRQAVSDTLATLALTVC